MLKPRGLQTSKGRLYTVNNSGLAANDRKPPGIAFSQCGISDDGNLSFADPFA